MSVNSRLTSRSRVLSGFRQDKEREKKRKVILAAILVSVILIGTLHKQIGILLGGATAYIAAPVELVAHGFGDRFTAVVNYFASKQHLQEENLRLTNLVERYSLEQYELESLRTENATLKTAFERLPKDSNFVLASVLAAPSVTPYDTLLIDLGMYEGVGEGMLVYHDGGFALGKVVTAYRHSALVEMFSSNGSELAAYVGTSSVPVIAHGVGAGNFRIFMPRNSEIKVGDTVSLPAFSPTFVGVIGGIDDPVNSSFSIIYVRTPFDYQRLREVYVAIPSVTRAQ